MNAHEPYKIRQGRAGNIQALLLIHSNNDTLLHKLSSISTVQGGE